MSDDHKTAQVDQFSVFRGILSQVASDVSAGRSETQEVLANVRRLETNQHLTHNEVVRLSGRVTGVEEGLVEVKADLGEVKGDLHAVKRTVDAHDGAIKKLTDADVTLSQHVTGTDFEREAEMAAIIVRQREADQARIAHEDSVKAALSEHEAMVSEKLAENERANRVVFTQLGVDYDRAVKPGSIPPDDKPPQTATLTKIKQENKASLIAGGLTFVIVVIELVMKLLH